MGFFSWQTGDTKESIANVHTWKHRKEGVYLLLPDGTKIHEPEYQGAGVFGGVNAYAQLGRQNAEHLGLNLSNDDEAHSLGVSLDVGQVFIHAQTNEIWHIFHTGAHSLLGGRIAKVRFNEHVEELGMTPTQAIRDKILRGVSVASLIDHLPLKFSFNPEAEYNLIGASERCPYQGFFYD